MYGRYRTKEEKEHLSKMLKGKKKPDGFGDKISKALKGKKKSPEAVAKQSHPVDILNVITNEVLHFPSHNECRRKIGIDPYLLFKNPNRISKGMYKLA